VSNIAKTILFLNLFPMCFFVTLVVLLYLSIVLPLVPVLLNFVCQAHILPGVFDFTIVTFSFLLRRNVTVGLKSLDDFGFCLTFLGNFL
jgi:hypothetical protein